MSNNTKRILPRLPVVGGLAALAFLLFVPDTAQAQSPVLFACFVPNSGVVYRVNPPGSPGQSADLKEGLFSTRAAHGGSTGQALHRARLGSKVINALGDLTPVTIAAVHGISIENGHLEGGADPGHDGMALEV